MLQHINFDITKCTYMTHIYREMRLLQMPLRETNSDVPM